MVEAVRTPAASAEEVRLPPPSLEIGDGADRWQRAVWPEVVLAMPIE